jgi:hypothetical protein
MVIPFTLRRILTPSYIKVKAEITGQELNRDYLFTVPYKILCNNAAEGGMIIAEGAKN